MSYTEGKFLGHAVAGNAVFDKANTGTERIAIMFQILEGPDESKYITWHGYFTPDTMEDTFKVMRLVGWQGDFFDLSTIGLEGTPTVRLTLQNEQGEKGVFTKVRWVNPVASVRAANPMSQGEIASFAARMKSQAASFQPRGNGAPKLPPAARNPTPRNEAPPPHTDDDIAF